MIVVELNYTSVDIYLILVSIRLSMIDLVMSLL